MKTFHEANKLESGVEKMPSVFQTDIIKGMYHVLSEEIGKPEARHTLERSFFWDYLFHRPEWHPEWFDLPDEKIADHYHKIFKELAPFISSFRSLKDEHGEARAQEICAKLAVPSSVPYLAKVFHRNDNITDIEDLRQELADYLGDGEGFEWTEEVSDDKSEVRYHFTRCVYIEILRAYGMTSAAAACCYCDHIIFDNITPELYFRRDHCKGVGDSFCDHDIRVRTPEDTAEDDLRYGDTDRADFDARALIQQWAENFAENGGKFSW